MIEAVAAMGLSAVVVTAALYLSSESSNQVSKRVAGSKGYLALQNLSEQLLVSSGANGYLDEGEHGPLYFDQNGKALSSGTGPISLTWTVHTNDPSPGIIKIDTSASWGEGATNKQTTSLVLYRSSPLRGSTTVVETVALPSPTPIPVTYDWGAPSSWTNCSSGGSQTRTVQCISSLGAAVADSQCTTTKPSTTQTCTPPVTYAWGSPSSWGTCSAGGSQSRTVSCMASTGSVASDSNCSSAKPATSQSCTPPVTYNWSSNTWSACSAGGSQTRTVTCLASTGSPAADAMCSGIKPATSQTCTPPTYNWYSGTWAACSAGGSQNRTVNCRSSTGATVADSNCLGTKPPNSQTCTPPTYDWYIGTWAACSAGGSQNRTVNCRSSTGATVADSNCSGTKPPNSQTCTPPVTYAWTTDSWTTCSAGGSQTRNVACMSSAGAPAADAMCPGLKPAATQSCTPPLTYAWGSPSAWSTCSAGGSQTRTVACMSSAGSVAPDGNCSSAKPPTTQTCTPPPVTYAWTTDTWATCSAGGSQTRNVTCMSSTGSVVSDGNCTGSKPAGSQTCTPPVTYAWTTDSWTACSAGGSQTRNVACMSSTGSIASDGNCSSARPPSTQTCTPPLTYAWYTGTWSMPTCEDDPDIAGRSRTVTCRSSAGVDVADGQCAGQKPSAYMECQRDFHN